MGHIALRPAFAGREKDAPDNLESLAGRYSADLLGYLRSRVPEQDAADIAQEAFVRLLGYRSSENEEGLRKLLFRIAQNLLTDHWRWSRTHAVERHVALDDVQLPASLPTQEAHFSSRKRLRKLEQTILKLPPKCRRVFVLSRIEGLSNAEVAQRCGISVKMVEKHLVQALARCRQQVGDAE